MSLWDKAKSVGSAAIDYGKNVATANPVVGTAVAGYKAATGDYSGAGAALANGMTGGMYSGVKTAYDQATGGSLGQQVTGASAVPSAPSLSGFADALGIGNTDTSALKTDTATSRDRGADFANQVSALQPRTAPQATAGQAGPAQGYTAMTTGNVAIAPQERASGATLAPTERAVAPTGISTREMQAGQVGPVERAAAQAAQAASISPAARMQAAQVAAAERVNAAQIDPVTGATAADAQAARIAAFERAGLTDAAATRMDTSQQSQFRADQAGLTNSLKDVIAGRGGPSAAEIQLQQGTQQNINNAQAMAAGTRGANQAGALRDAARQAGSMNQGLAQQQALVRAQETAAARGQLAGVLSEARGQDIGIAGQQANLSQQLNLANASQSNNSSQFNAGQANSQALEQARLQQSAALQNAQASTNVSLANSAAYNSRAANQAQLAQQAALSNQSAANAVSAQQAGLNQQAGLANQSADNTRSLEQARMTQQVDMFNAGSQNDMAARNAAAANAAASQQATLDQGSSQFNAGQVNDATKLAAQMQAQNSQFNATQGNAASLEAARLAQQSSQFNAGQANDLATKQAALDAQTGQFNATSTNAASQFGAQAQNQVGLTNATLTNTTNNANVDAILKSTQLDDAQKKALIDAMQNEEKMTLGADNDAATIAAADAARRAKLVGDTMQSAGSLGSSLLPMLSDKAQKRDIKSLAAAVSERIHDDEDDIGEFLSKVRPVSYRYKDSSLDGAAPGKRYGILAQDLERSPMGKSLVIDSREGKKVDVAQAVGAMLAAMAQMHGRLKSVEGRRTR